MTEESGRAFNDRRANEENALAEQAADTVQVLAHRKLAELHEKKAFAVEPIEDPLAVAAVGGSVTVTTASGEVTSLTPMAAMVTSDRLAVRAREADRQSCLSKASLTPKPPG